MKAIEFEQHNVVFAKDQKEYLPLVVVNGSGGGRSKKIGRET